MSAAPVNCNKIPGNRPSRVSLVCQMRLTPLEGILPDGGARLSGPCAGATIITSLRRQTAHGYKSGST